MWQADARAFSRPTFKAREKRPGDEVETDPSFEKFLLQWNLSFGRPQIREHLSGAHHNYFPLNICLEKHYCLEFSIT